MSFGRETTDTLVKPLGGAIVRRYTTGAAVEAGEGLYLDSNGKVQPANGSAVATNYVIGVAVQDGASGDRIDVVVHGPILCLIDATPGGIIYQSDTAGEPGTSAGTKTTIWGVAETATVLFVRPQIVSLS